LGKPAVSPEQFSTFGDLLKYLRRREELTQRALAVRVGYSDTQISRIEKNQRVPDAATLTALFVPALHIEREAEWVARLLELAGQARIGPSPETVTTEKTIFPNNLPALLTTFIGREKEQAEIIQWLIAHRLVTVTGSGGIGKTRISLMVGGQLLGEYADGIWLAELAPLSDPGLLEQTVASVIGIATRSTTVSYTELLINFLRNRTALLILDNCEHLIAACASLTDTLLKNCPQLKILATSREALGILGEIQYRLPSLGLPGDEQPLEKIREYGSVRLFEERARLARSDFKLTMENASSVAQICSHLDGIPLAIELAAARVNIFSTAQIAARLHDRFDLLAGGSRTDQPRYQTLRASIDWSWNLISEPERTLLRRLTVFAGGWTLEAAESVCSTAGVESHEVSGLLSQLVAKSLVIANSQPGPEPRFHLHETIRQYAHEKLIEAGEQENIRIRHLKYFLELSEKIESGLLGPQQAQQGEWSAHAHDDRDNLRGALEQASKMDVEAGLYLSGRLQGFWEIFDMREGERWLVGFIQKPGSINYPQAKARALLALGWLLIWNQRFSEVQPIAQECLALYRACAVQQGEADALLLLGFILQLQDDRASADEYYERSLALARSLGDVRRQARALFRLGYDRPDVQLAYWEEAITLSRAADDQVSLAGLLYPTARFVLLLTGDIETAQKHVDEAGRLVPSMGGFTEAGWAKGLIAFRRGDYKKANAHLRQVAVFTEEKGDQMSYLWTRAYLGFVALQAGDLIEARQLFTNTAQNFHKAGNTIGVVYALEGLAGLYAATRKHTRAARLIGWADAARENITNPRPLVEQADVDRDIAGIMAKIGSSAFEVAYDSGRGMTLDEAVAFALDIKD
jgi:predicted ATPase/DNA-binding XRE family transcriptional regulator